MSKKNANEEFEIETEIEKDDKCWDKTSNKEILKYNQPIKHIEYSITQKFIDDSKILDKIVTYDNKHEYNLVKYYLTYDTKNKMNPYITCSRTPIETTIMNDLININIKKTNEIA